MVTVAWTAIGLLAATLVGSFYYLGQRIDSQGDSLGQRIDSLGQRIDSQGARLNARIDAQGAELSARIDAQGAELSARIDAQSARLDDVLRQLSELARTVQAHLTRHAG